MEAYHRYSDDFIKPIQNEPLFEEENRRYSVFPIKYQGIWAIHVEMNSVHWTVEEIDLSKDLRDWVEKLSDDDRTFLKHVLAFFASADGIVNANISENVFRKIVVKEAECAFGKQYDMENVHGHMYSLLLDVLITDLEEKDRLFRSIETMPCIAKKADWCERWINSDKPYSHKLVAFAVVEGVFFSGSFASIFWLKTRPGSVMPGLRKSNKFIARDESLHVKLACEIFSLLLNHPRQEIVHQIIDEAVLIEDEFINEALKCRLLGMNSILMSQYIRYCADRLMVQLGYEKKYNVEMPLEYMKKIDSFCKTNQFEHREDNYSDASIDNPRVWKILKRC